MPDELPPLRISTALDRSTPYVLSYGVARQQFPIDSRARQTERMTPEMASFMEQNFARGGAMSPNMFVDGERVTWHSLPKELDPKQEPLKSALEFIGRRGELSGFALRRDAATQEWILETRTRDGSVIRDWGIEARDAIKQHAIKFWGPGVEPQNERLRGFAHNFVLASEQGGEKGLQTARAVAGSIQVDYWTDPLNPRIISNSQDPAVKKYVDSLNSTLFPDGSVIRSHQYANPGKALYIALDAAHLKVFGTPAKPGTLTEALHRAHESLLTSDQRAINERVRNLVHGLEMNDVHRGPGGSEAFAVDWTDPKKPAIVTRSIDEGDKKLAQQLNADLQQRLGTAHAPQDIDRALGAMHTARFGTPEPLPRSRHYQPFHTADTIDAANQSFRGLVRDLALVHGHPRARADEIAASIKLEWPADGTPVVKPTSTDRAVHSVATEADNLLKQKLTTALPDRSVGSAAEHVSEAIRQSRVHAFGTPEHPTSRGAELEKLSAKPPVAPPPEPEVAHRPTRLQPGEHRATVKPVSAPTRLGKFIPGVAVLVAGGVGLMHASEVQAMEKAGRLPEGAAREYAMIVAATVGTSVVGPLSGLAGDAAINTQYEAWLKKYDISPELARKWQPTMFQGQTMSEKFIAAVKEGSSTLREPAALGVIQAAHDIDVARRDLRDAHREFSQATPAGLAVAGVTFRRGEDGLWELKSTVAGRPVPEKLQEIVRGINEKEAAFARVNAGFVDKLEVAMQNPEARKALMPVLADAAIGALPDKPDERYPASLNALIEAKVALAEAQTRLNEAGSPLPSPERTAGVRHRTVPVTPLLDPDKAQELFDKARTEFVAALARSAGDGSLDKFGRDKARTAAPAPDTLPEAVRKAAEAARPTITSVAATDMAKPEDSTPPLRDARKPDEPEKGATRQA